MSLVRIVVTLAGAAPVIFFARRSLRGIFRLRNLRGIVPLLVACFDAWVLLSTLAIMLLLNPFP